MMEAEEIDALASFSPVHDPRLVRLELQTQFGQDRGERLKGALGLLLGRADRKRIIGVADQNSVSTRLPLPVKLVQVDVAQAG